MSKSFEIWYHFFPLLFPQDSENPKSLDIKFREMGTKKHLNGVNKWKKSFKNFFFRRSDFTPFMRQVFKSETTSFHYFSPKDSENLKSLDIGLREVGVKRRLNGVNKWRRKKYVNKLFCRCDFTPFMNRSFQIWDHFFPLLFPKDYESLKSLHIRL